MALTWSCRHESRPANRLHSIETAAMILLDTNVVSEMMRAEPDPAVDSWAVGQVVETLFFSAVGEAELRYGAAIRPKGRRRYKLVSDIEGMLRNVFEGRVLSFDSSAAREYAEIVADRRRNGRPISQADGQIAAIARSQRLAIATRSVRDFEDTGGRLDRSLGEWMNGLSRTQARSRTFPAAVSSRDWRSRT